MTLERIISQPVSLLMPVCNEAEVIENVIEEWVADVFNHLPAGSEFLIDEAGSTDGTKEILSELAERHPFLRVTTHDKKDGFANAARRLYIEAKCPLLFFTDSDGQYIAEDFWKLVRYIEHYDLVLGAKIGRKDPFLRRFFSSIFNKTTGFLFELHYLDINSAFRLMRTDMVKAVMQHVNVMPTLLNAELILRCELDNYQIKQVYVLHRQRRFGRSRGLSPHRYLWEGVKAVRGLLAIKAGYRL